MLVNALSLIAVGLLWGATNPFIKKGSKGIDKVDTGSKWKNLYQEIKLVGSRIDYWVPFLLNQSGSLLYVWTLQSTDISVAVPVANSLSFVFTAITGFFMGEKIPGKRVLLGTLLVCIGSTFMIYDKIRNESKQKSE